MAGQTHKPSALASFLLALLLCQVGSSAIAQPQPHEVRLASLELDWSTRAAHWWDETSACFQRLQSKAQRARAIEQSLEEACDGGEVGGCTQLGILYEDGLVGASDPARAGALYGEACKWQGWDGCYRLAQLTRQQKPESSEDIALLRRACLMDHIPSCERYLTRQSGLPEEARPQELYDVLEPRCSKQNDAASCAHLGVLFHRKSLETNAKSLAAGFYKRGCIKGSAFACHALGNMTKNGEGTARSISKAIALFATACEGELPEGCRNAGVSTHEVGNSAAAAPYFERACELGEPDSCHYLGVLLELGVGVKQDIPRATSLHQTSCAQGVARGCFSLGLMYWQGLGVKASIEEATALFTLACKHGDALGCRNMGNLAVQGLGVPQDNEAATRYYEKGCRLGDGQSCYNLAQMWAARNVDRERVDELRAMACVKGYERACSQNR